MPRVISIERKTKGGIVICDAKKYLSHPGFPMAVILDKPTKGGGAAHFFADREAFVQLGITGLTDEMWLPQIVCKLYFETPSVVLGLSLTGSTGQMGGECRVLAFGEPAKLVGRASKN
ncbi:MAG: hypothetical protein CK529_06615 [Rhodospirillaceae bacterium]|nr:MAG: hypothetical protein CK529_06615 [Rhodospirillaceae bacterium]